MEIINKIAFFILLEITAFMSFSCKKCSELVLTKDKKSDYSIVVNKNSSDLVFYSASELQHYLEQISEVKLPIVKANVQENTIVLSSNVDYQEEIFADSLRFAGTDGFLIKQVDNSLIIASVNGRGLLYGIYTFLEDQLGCRWYSSSVKKIPFSPTIILKNIYNVQIPKIKYREVYYYDACDPEFAAQLKLNGNAQKRGKTGENRYAIQGGRHAGWGLWCHSLYSLVSPELFGRHPEYFSLIDGKRAKPQEFNTQLCLSNPEVTGLIIKSLEEKMQDSVTDLPIWAEKEDYYWSVSQMDGTGNCECEECKKLDALDGSPMGSILHMVNRVAKHFPDKKIGTLAYIYSRKAPQITIPEKNVAIQLCAIETGRDGINLPIRTSNVHKSFRDDLVAWGKICNDIIIWDYEVQFQNLVCPFPNFEVMQDNIKYYTENNVSGIFCQGNREKGGEFCELRTYVLSKLLWNPDRNINNIIDDFMTGYYGEAGKFIRRYFDLTHAELNKSGLALSMDGEPSAHSNGFLSEKLLTEYNKIFDEAEKAVMNNPDILLRVREARLPLMYAQLKLGYGTVNERKRVAADFFDLAKQTDLWMLSEVDWRDDQSGNIEMFKEKLGKSGINN